MSDIRNFFSMYWKRKSFRIHTFFVMLLLLGLFVKSGFFEDSFMSIIRNYYLIVWLYASAWFDHKKRIIPNKILCIAFFIRIIFFLLEEDVAGEPGRASVIPFFAGGLIAGGMFFLCYIVTRGRVGGGDVKLVTVLGFYVGNHRIFTTLLFALVYAFAHSIGILVFKKTGVKQQIPFAPFVFLGTVTTFFLER